MATGRLIEAWSQTSRLIAEVVNSNRQSKKDKIRQPLEFHPYADELRAEIRRFKSANQSRQAAFPLTVLRDVFVKRQFPKGTIDGN